MPVKSNVFDVEYHDPDPREFRVRVTMQDRLNAEMRGRKYGLLDATAQPNLVAFLWLYFASIRTGDIDPATTFDEFQTRCVENTKVEGEEDVDPTRQGQSPDSPST